MSAAGSSQSGAGKIFPMPSQNADWAEGLSVSLFDWSKVGKESIIMKADKSRYEPSSTEGKIQSFYGK